MKRIFFLATLLCSLSALSKNFEAEFYDCLTDKQYAEAESLLSQWQSSDPGNPELYAARFNLFLNRAHNTGLAICYGDSTYADSPSIAFCDSTGTVAGQIVGMDEWNAPLVKKGIAAIDEGIAKNNRRLDFHFGKITALIFIEDFNEIYTSICNILETDKKINSQWLWSHDEKIENASTELLDGLHDFERQFIYGDIADDDFALSVLHANTKYYPKDFVALNMIGAVEYSRGNRTKAREYMELASDANPEDQLIKCNIAYLIYQDGDKNEAIKLYKKVLESTSDNEEPHSIAKEMLDMLSEED